MKVTKVSQKYKDMSDDELKSFIKEKLSMDPKWARRALTALYDEQTEAEQEDPVNVHESNGRGFSPQDQEFLSSLAKQALAGNVSFSQKQLGWLYQLLPKYAGQLVKMIRELERMEPNFIFTAYFAQFTIYNERSEMESLTGTLGLEARSMPDHILVTSPSRLQEMLFFLKDVNIGPQGPQLFLYEEIKKKEDGKKKWSLIISVADPDPIPSEAEAIDLLSGKKGVKKK